jgi:dipeptidyl aminopeptidase/acylaminoacyl peptidase
MTIEDKEDRALYMNQALRVAQAAITLLTFGVGTSVSQMAQKRTVQPIDCVQVKYPYDDGLNALYGLLAVNPKGTQVAYIVKTPNLATNENVFQLYVKTIADSTNGAGSIVLTSKSMSHATWLADGRHLVVLAQYGGTDSIVSVDIRSRTESVIAHSNRDITQYSIDALGDRVVFTRPVLAIGERKPDEEPNLTDGYRIRFGSSSAKPNQDEGNLYILERTASLGWERPKVLSVTDPLSEASLTSFPRIRHLSMSPNGHQFIFSYNTTNLGPSRWDIAVMYEFATHRSTIPFKGETDSIPFWSSDSSSYLVSAHSPEGTSWEKRDARDHFTGPGDTNMFLVYPSKALIEEISPHVPDHHEQPLAWRSDGRVVLRIAPNSVGWFRESNGKWELESHRDIPLTPIYRFSIRALASNGRQIFGVYQTPSVAPDIFAFDPETSKLQIMTRLNPQLEDLSFAAYRMFSWMTASGKTREGFLFMPVNYDPKRRYPLIIQTKGNQGWFACDSGFNHDPAFIPQPAANAGMMYLVETFQQPEPEPAINPDYPGQISEAVNEMETWEAAVEELDRRRLVDPSKIGIIGFSRTGWQVEFDLVHSKIKFAAATVADNVQYSLGEYWLLNNETTIRDFDAMYGGPPYGRSLEAWKQYSISFNLDKIHTPLLMENMGYGALDDFQGEIPSNLAPSFEVFVGLSRLDRPVDFYYYPLEEHAPNRPRARLASLMRNLDWYRFWLLGEERLDAKKQNTLWEQLRKSRIQHPDIAGANP